MTKGLSSRQMSKLYKNLQKKGYSRDRAYYITGFAKKLSKKHLNKKWKGKFGKYAYLDFDGDKKVNKYDCFSLNKDRQDNLKVGKHKIKRLTSSNINYLKDIAKKTLKPTSGKVYITKKNGIDFRTRKDIYNDRMKVLKEHSITGTQQTAREAKSKRYSKELKPISLNLPSNEFKREVLTKKKNKIDEEYSKYTPTYNYSIEF